MEIALLIGTMAGSLAGEGVGTTIGPLGPLLRVGTMPVQAATASSLMNVNLGDMIAADPDHHLASADQRLNPTGAEAPAPTAAQPPTATLIFHVGLEMMSRMSSCSSCKKLQGILSHGSRKLSATDT